MKHLCRAWVKIALVTAILAMKSNVTGITHISSWQKGARMMSDLISRQEAIDALCEDYCSGRHDCKYYPKCENLRSIQELPSAQPEKRTEKRTETHACDLISRQAAIDGLFSEMPGLTFAGVLQVLQNLPSAQPEQHHDEWCTDCREYDKEKHCCPRFNKVIRTAMEDMRDEDNYERGIEQEQHDMLYEPTYNSEDGSM